MINYPRDRINDQTKRFSTPEIDMITRDVKSRFINFDHALLLKGERPKTKFTKKPQSDALALELWNVVFFNMKKFQLSRISDVKSVAAKVLKYYNNKYPNGDGMNESEFIQYVQAMSASSYIGIQEVKSSSTCLDSIIFTLEEHNKHPVKDKPWLIPNLESVHDHLCANPKIVDRSYADVMINAKRSSSSIPGEGKYRDYVMQKTMADLLQDVTDNLVPYVLFAGVRLDRRGKYRLVCSPDARHRIIDFILVNGSYELCSPEGLYGKYTTEGLGGTKMWLELKKMSNRDKGFSLACIDYKGYDTQISQDEYLQLVYLLNKHRLHIPDIRTLYEWFDGWIKQPKPVVQRDSEGLEILTSLYTTLPSGLHGTHSFENLIGISMYLQLEKEGIQTNGFWTNGDDQNVFIASEQIEEFIKFVNRYFQISWDKSLVGHKASVWSKLWFTDEFSPVCELGTLRSLYEKEGGSNDLVEESKFESNYCKIVQVAMHLIRLGVDEIRTRIWIKELCSRIGVKHNVIPKTLFNVTPIVSNRKIGRPEPLGLMSVKKELEDRNLPMNILEVRNIFELMIGMYRTVPLFSMELERIDYHPENTTVTIRAGKDFSEDDFGDVPNNIKKLMIVKDQFYEDGFIRSVLQGTKSYDGQSDISYRFHDIYSLAHSLCIRNVNTWITISSIN
jgi:hypothetical protein